MYTKRPSWNRQMAAIHKLLAWSCNWQHSTSQFRSDESVMRDLCGYLTADFLKHWRPKQLFLSNKTYAALTYEFFIPRPWSNIIFQFFKKFLILHFFHSIWVETKTFLVKAQISEYLKLGSSSKMEDNLDEPSSAPSFCQRFLFYQLSWDSWLLDYRLGISCCALVTTQLFKHGIAPTDAIVRNTFYNSTVKAFIWDTGNQGSSPCTTEV